MSFSSVDNRSVSQAKTLLRNGQVFRALQTLEYLAVSGPAQAEVLELLGVARAKTGDLDGACDALERATSCEPGAASPHFNYAVLLAQMGRLDDASAEIDVTLYLEPNHTGALALQQNVAVRLRDRRNRTHHSFAVVAQHRPDPVASPATEWARLKCQSCAAMNFVTARTCRRCGALLSQDEPVVPLE